MSLCDLLHCGHLPWQVSWTESSGRNAIASHQSMVSTCVHCDLSILVLDPASLARPPCGPLGQSSIQRNASGDHLAMQPSSPLAKLMALHRLSRCLECVDDPEPSQRPRLQTQAFLRSCDCIFMEHKAGREDVAKRALYLATQAILGYAGSEPDNEREIAAAASSIRDGQIARECFLYLMSWFGGGLERSSLALQIIQFILKSASVAAKTSVSNSLLQTGLLCEMSKCLHSSDIAALALDLVLTALGIILETSLSDQDRLDDNEKHVTALAEAVDIHRLLDLIPRQLGDEQGSKPFALLSVILRLSPIPVFRVWFSSDAARSSMAMVLGNAISCRNVKVKTNAIHLLCSVLDVIHQIRSQTRQDPCAKTDFVSDQDALPVELDHACSTLLQALSRGGILDFCWEALRSLHCSETVPQPASLVPVLQTELGCESLAMEETGHDLTTILLGFSVMEDQSFHATLQYSMPIMFMIPWTRLAQEHCLMYLALLGKIMSQPASNLDRGCILDLWSQFYQLASADSPSVSIIEASTQVVSKMLTWLILGEDELEILICYLHSLERVFAELNQPYILIQLYRQAIQAISQRISSNLVVYAIHISRRVWSWFSVPMKLCNDRDLEMGTEFWNLVGHINFFFINCQQALRESNESVHSVAQGEADWATLLWKSKMIGVTISLFHAITSAPSAPHQSMMPFLNNEALVSRLSLVFGEAMISLLRLETLRDQRIQLFPQSVSCFHPERFVSVLLGTGSNVELSGNGATTCAGENSELDCIHEELVRWWSVSRYYDINDGDWLLPIYSLETILDGSLKWYCSIGVLGQNQAVIRLGFLYLQMLNRMDNNVRRSNDPSVEIREDFMVCLLGCVRNQESFPPSVDLWTLLVDSTSKLLFSYQVLSDFVDLLVIYWHQLEHDLRLTIRKTLECSDMTWSIILRQVGQLCRLEPGSTSDQEASSRTDINLCRFLIFLEDFAKQTESLPSIAFTSSLAPDLLQCFQQRKMVNLVLRIFLILLGDRNSYRYLSYFREALVLFAGALNGMLCNPNTEEAEDLSKPSPLLVTMRNVLLLRLSTFLSSLLVLSSHEDSSYVDRIFVRGYLSQHAVTRTCFEIATTDYPSEEENAHPSAFQADWDAAAILSGTLLTYGDVHQSLDISLKEKLCAAYQSKWVSAKDILNRPHANAWSTQWKHYFILQLMNGLYDDCNLLGGTEVMPPRSEKCSNDALNLNSALSSISSIIMSLCDYQMHENTTISLSLLVKLLMAVVEQGWVGPLRGLSILRCYYRSLASDLVPRLEVMFGRDDAIALANDEVMRADSTDRIVHDAKDILQLATISFAYHALDLPWDDDWVSVRSWIKVLQRSAALASHYSRLRSARGAEMQVSVNNDLNPRGDVGTDKAHIVLLLEATAWFRLFSTAHTRSQVVLGDDEEVMPLRDASESAWVSTQAALSVWTERSKTQHSILTCLQSAIQDPEGSMLLFKDASIAPLIQALRVSELEYQQTIQDLSRRSG